MKQNKLPDLLVIKNVELWNKDGVSHEVDVFVQNGKITDVFSAGNENFDGESIEGKGKILLPSGVDAHVHLRVPGQTHKERPDTGLKAAIRGGYGAVLNMPNTSPPVDSVEVCEMAMSAMKPAIENTGVEVFLSACITKGMKGEQLTNIDALAEWGVKTFTDDGLGVESDEMMDKVFKAASKYNIPVSQHAEFKGHGGILAGGSTQKNLHIPFYPASAEYEMVARDIRELKKTPGARYHVLHISLAKSVELLEEAKDDGLNVSCEVTPHHLYYTFEEIPENNTYFKMNPPLRDVKDRMAMQNALSSGDIAFVATDHAPHAENEKGNDFEKAAFGTTGMETSILVLLDLLRKGKIDERRLVDSFATAPAKYLSIENRFGYLKNGSPFNAILIDKDFGPHKISDTDLASLSHNNIFLGAELPGRVVNFFNPQYQFNLS